MPRGKRCCVLAGCDTMQVMKKASSRPAAQSAIHPERARYIKLGRGGKWERECLDRGIVRFGFGAGSPQRFPLCSVGKWDELTESFVAEGRDKGTATRFANETRLFFQDDGSTLWITFVGEQLCWGFLTPTGPQPHPDGGVWRAVAGGWKRNVFHSGEAETNGEDDKVTVIGPDKLAELVLDAGLVNWLIRKVS